MNIPKKQNILIAILAVASCLGIWAYLSSHRGATTQPHQVFPAIPALTEEKAIDALRTKNEVLLLFVHMKKCGPCKCLAPKFDQLASENQHENVYFVKIDRDDAAQLCKKYDIKAFPTVLLFKKGDLVKISPEFYDI